MVEYIIRNVKFDLCKPDTRQIYDNRSFVKFQVVVLTLYQRHKAQWSNELLQKYKTEEETEVTIYTYMPNSFPTFLFRNFAVPYFTKMMTGIANRIFAWKIQGKNYFKCLLHMKNDKWPKQNIWKENSQHL